MATEQPSLDSLCYNLSNLQQLARQGSWRSLVETIAQARKLSLPHFPHEQLVHHAYLVLAHMKLRKYGDASQELDALSDLDSPQYQFQHYPDLYPHRRGSMIPFVLRWLHAELPYYLNQPSATFERLYSLYDCCQRGIDRFLASDKSREDSRTHQDMDSQNATNAGLQSIGGGGGVQEPMDTSSNDNTELARADPDNEFGDFVSGMAAAIDDVEKSIKDCESTSASVGSGLKIWRQRQEVVVNSIISHHLHQKDFTVVIKLFGQLVHMRPSNPSLLSKLGYVQMQMGDLSGASYTFTEVENIVKKTPPDSLQLSALKGLVCRNKGLHHMVHKQYTEAAKEFDAALSIDPTDTVAANNKALCCMYNRDLIGSTKVLESILDKAPVLALNENLVLNLCSMYELAFVHNVQTKKNLSEWIQQIAPGDFDFSCTRL